MITHARRAGRWSLTAVMILVIAACAAWILPSLFGYSRYVITSGSMTGTYDKGSIVFEKKVAVGDLKVGDVITYMPPSNSGVAHLVTHRIYRMEPAQGGGTLFTTKGDHNPAADPWHFQLVGNQQSVVQFGVPHAGWIFIALAHRQVRLLVIGLPAALIALGALVELLSNLGRRSVEAPADAFTTRWISPSIVEQEYEVV
ncbi:MAG: signal peptidase I [Marmoricola sp.]